MANLGLKMQEKILKRQFSDSLGEGPYIVFSLLLGKPIVILSDIFSGTQPSNRQHGCWRRRFQPWKAMSSTLLKTCETPVTEAATNLGNRKKYHLVSLGEAEQQ